MLARTFILFGIISATADAAASPIFHPHQGCGLECCSGDWTDVLECPAGWTTYNGKCYKAGSDITGHTAKWSAARTACESEGAFLVTINDQAENNFVSNDLCGSTQCWIGGNDMSVEAHASTDASAWQWDNGETSGYSNFAPGEPNDWGGASYFGHGEDCLHMKSNGKWNDAGCGIEGRDNEKKSGSINYVCEKLPVTSTPTCTPTGGTLQVRHSNTDHSHHRCFADDNEPNGCRCMCADMAFDGTESKAPTHCSALEGDKTIKTFDTSAQWLTGTYTERNGNISDTGDAYAAHCRPTTEGTLFSDHEKVRMVATFHPVTSTMHASDYGGENSWKINEDCAMAEGVNWRHQWHEKCAGSYRYSSYSMWSGGEARTHNIMLGSGTHNLTIEDSFGDGWSGGYLTLAYEDGTEFLSTQGNGFGEHGVTRSYECLDDVHTDGKCYKKTIQFTVEPTSLHSNTATLVTENLKCDWESPFINIDNTGFDQHSIAALDIATNFKEEGHKDSDDSYKVWITACTGLDGGGSCTEQLVHAVYDDTAATAVYHDSVSNGDAPSNAPAVCGCEVAGESFCNFDYGYMGGCELCEMFSSVERCFNDGLPAAGAADCASRCFGETAGPINIGEAHKSYKVRVETSAAGEDNKYFINSVKVNAVCAPPAAEILLFEDSSNSENVFGHAFSGWYNAGSTVASGNGKRSEYDTKQCNKFRFEVPGSTGTVTNPDGRTSLLALLQSTGKNQGSSNTGSAIWDSGHKDLYYSSRTGTAFGSESHMTLVHGDGTSYDGGDWVTFSFEPDAATNNGDWDYRAYFAFGHEYFTHKEGSSVTAKIYGVDCI